MKGLAFMEAIVRPLTWDEFPEEARQMFQGFRTPEVGENMLINQNMFVEAVLPTAILRKLTDEEMNRYREPYVDPPSRKPLWRWPNELPIEGEPADVVEVARAYSEWFGKSDVPKLLLRAQPGAIMREPLVEWCRENMRDLKTVEIGAGAHFVQEDQPQAIGEAVAEWYRGL